MLNNRWGWTYHWGLKRLQLNVQYFSISRSLYAMVSMSTPQNEELTFVRHSTQLPFVFQGKVAHLFKLPPPLQLNLTFSSKSRSGQNNLYLVLVGGIQLPHSEAQQAELGVGPTGSEVLSIHEGFSWGLGLWPPSWRPEATKDGVEMESWMPVGS